MDVRVRILGEFEVEAFASHSLGTRNARALLNLPALARARPIAGDHLVDFSVADEGTAPGRRQVQVGCS
jgi:hypothetical protein